jgi:hypothetical protein
MLTGQRPYRLLAGGAVAVLATVVPTGVAHAVPTGSTVSAASDQAGAGTSCPSVVDFGHEEFHHPTTIDNEYLPFVPGTRLTYEGRVAAGGSATPHQVIFTVTDLTKEIDGVRSRVVHDVDVSNGAVAEAELSFWAQSDGGNVWNVGEYPEEYDAGKFSGAPNVWISGLDGATAGIHMLAHPEDPANRNQEYSQGKAPAIDFLDCASVASVDGTVDVPTGHYRDVLATHERSPLASTTAIQAKDHAPGVGIVRISALNDPEAETLVLIDIAHLNAPDLHDVDKQAFQLDGHGHRINETYAQTPRLQGQDDGRSHAAE